MAVHKANKLAEITRKYMPSLWLWYVLGGSCFILTTWLTLRIPTLIKRLVDGYVHSGNTSEYASLALAICAIGVAIMFIRTLSRVFIFWAGRLVESLLRHDYFIKSLSFARQSLEKIPVGDLISRMSTDMRQIGFLYGLGITLILNFVLMLSFVIYNMVMIHSWLTVYVLLPAFLHVGIMRFIAPLTFKHSTHQQKQVAHLSSRIAESFHNVQALQAEGAVSSFIDTISQSNDDVYKANLKLLMLRETVFPLLALLTPISYVITFFYGGTLTVQGAISLGDLAAFNTYIALLNMPLGNIAFFITVRERAKAACIRLQELDDLENEKHREAISSQKLQEDAQAGVEIKNLDFQYPAGNHPVLKNFSLTITKGEHLVLAGRIGSGKSTLSKILTGFYPTKPGTYLLNGIDVCELSCSQIRQQVGWVTQEAQFFSGTIRHNLLLGDDHPDMINRLEKVCKDVCLYDEIMGFNEGFESHIGEDGIRLSGGQKQRLSLARALLRKRSLYILDDVFSALDHSTEERIIHMLSTLPATFLIISHRPSVMRFCNRVALLDKGTIVALATYEELKDSAKLQSYISSDSSASTTKNTTKNTTKKNL
ncbi:MAG: ABC transporter ATP-binding protein [Proteobacteria bacterium]|nr:ABC transporter ATP-binding protein [Pseudomonadota bacterium]